MKTRFSLALVITYLAALITAAGLFGIIDSPWLLLPGESFYMPPTDFCIALALIVLPPMIAVPILIKLLRPRRPRGIVHRTPVEQPRA